MDWVKLISFVYITIESILKQGVVCLADGPN